MYLEPNTIGWQPLLRKWLQSNFEWQKNFEETLSILFEWTVPPCLRFLDHCHQICQVNEITLVKTSIQIFEMLLNETYELIVKKEEDPKNLSSWIQASFIQAIIWGLGSTLDAQSRLKFDEFFKTLWRGHNPDYPHPESLEKIEVGVPLEEGIFDHCYLYKSKGNWKFWSDMLKNEKIDEDFVPTTDTLRYSMIINMHIINNYPLILMGPTGTGKTTIMWDILTNKIDRNIYETSFLTFTTASNVPQMREMILFRLLKRKMGNYGPRICRNSVIFIDDFNEPLSNLELIRELLDRKTWYNLTNFEPFSIENVNILAAMTTNYQNNKLCQRLLRHFNLFSINELIEDNVCRIFTSVLLTKLRRIGFPSDILSIVNQIIAGTLHFYKEVIKLKPKLNWNFYQFDLKHFSTIVQVCAMIRKDSADSNKKLFYKLWTHEISRVLGDRLLDEDQDWFSDNIKYCTEEIFKEEMNTLYENLIINEELNLSRLLFGKFDQNGRFDEIDMNKMKDIATEMITKQNLDMVLFDHAISTLSKLCRILSIPGCNLILVGMCATGRETLVKLACLILNQKLFRPRITRNFDMTKWCQTVKTVFKESGCFAKSCTLYLKEHEIIIDNQILDNLMFLLKTGEVPLLLNAEEQQEMLNIVRSNMNIEIDDNPDMTLLTLKNRCRQNLHIVLSFNPRNKHFRECLRRYPTIIKFCAVNFIKESPCEGLETIASTWIKDLNLDKYAVIVNLLSTIHDDIKNFSNIKIPITLRSYLDFIRIFVNFIEIRRDAITEIKLKYLSALEKLSLASNQIAEMQKSLAEYQPQLAAMTKQASEMAQEIESETNQIDKVSNLVKKDEKIANEQAAAAQILKLDCEADLAQAIPILEDAISALNTLKPTDITLVKSMKNPPDAIKLVMAAVCVIKDVKPDRIPDPSTGRKIIDYWGPSKRILGDMNFLQTLKDFDKDNIKPEIMVKVRKDYLPHKDFKPHIVAKASSAAEGLCKWIIAMDMYDKVAKEVAPKKEKLEKAEREYGATVTILNEKKEQVSRIEQKLIDLNVLLKEATRKQHKLQNDVDYCKRKLVRAQKLLEGLSKEKIRWTEAVDELEKEYQNLPGDTLLSSAVIAYCGPLGEAERAQMLIIWMGRIDRQEISLGETYNFVGIFEKYVDFDKWHLNGLLKNKYFVENGIITTFSRRWILLIDPQNQATVWIKTNEKQNNIKCTKYNQSNYIDVIKECITLGYPLLIENISEDLEPFLLNLITKTTFQKDNQHYVELNDEIICYHENFQLYFTTNMKFPTYSSEMYDKLTIIDFGMTLNCVEQDLLISVTEYEKPALKRIKNIIDTEHTQNKDDLRNIEIRILKTLSESKIDILEDDQALQVLDEAKLLSKKIEDKKETLIPLEKQLIEFRESYQNVSAHSANLYFTVYQLTKLNWMYQFSYSWFLETFLESMQKAQKYKVLDERQESLIDTLTYMIYIKTSKSIFESDKMIFSFLLCTNILILKNIISIEDINTFKSIESINIDNGDITRMELWSQISNLAMIPKELVTNETTMELLFDSSKPEQETFPDLTNPLSKLILIKMFRPDRIFKAIENFVSQELAPKYINPPFFDLTSSFEDSYILSPLLFIVKTGSNPISSLQEFARRKNFHNKLKLIPYRGNVMFDKTLEECQNLGYWVCVENCHLFPQFLAHLDLKLDELDYINTHENFRLWLTTHETDAFPLTLLEKSIKIIKEPPNDIQKKLLNLYTQEPINSSFYTNCPGKHDIFVKFLYSISLLHSIFQERSTFGWFGWEMPYQFDEYDFSITIHELQNIVRSYTLPFSAISNLIKNRTYGCRIIDRIDTKLFNETVDDFINFNQFDNSFPIKTDCQDFINHISMLEIDCCDIMALHDNYNVVRDTKLSKKILDQITSDVSNDVEISNIFEMIPDLISQIPDEIAINLILDDTIINSIVLNEVTILNELISRLSTTLNMLQLIFKSNSLLPSDLEEVCDYVSRYRVPPRWCFYNIPDNLSKYFEVLKQRVEYFRNYQNVQNQSLWLCRFTKPKAFLMALRLYFSDVLSIPLESLSIALSRNFIDSKSIEIASLFITGANWNTETELLEELAPRIIYHNLRGCYFIFKEITSENHYQCPLYTSINCARNNSLLGTSNLICSSIKLKTEMSSVHWIRRRTSLLCQI